MDISENGNGVKDSTASEAKRHMPRVKVCGMTNLKQMHQLGDVGVDFAGLIFYHKSPRFVMRHLKGYQVKKEKLKVFKIGVFVNASYEEVMNHVDNFGLDMVQLHGDERPYFCERISNYVSVIKAFRITPDDNIEWKIKDYYADSDMYLFDTEGSGYGGTGKKFDWRMLSGLNVNKSFLLSGGIQPGDEGDIKKFLKDPVSKDLFSIDINSRFETAPGVKNIEAIKTFVSNLRSAEGK